MAASRRLRSGFALALALGLATAKAPHAASEAAPSVTAVTATEAASPPVPRTLLFGDLHVHSSWSFDAYGAGVTARPRDAYRYARGESIAHAGGVPIRLAGPPLDFMALTDHAEYLGVMQAAFDPQHVLRKQPLIRSLTGDDPRARRLAFRRIRETFGRREGLPALTQPSVVEPAWRALVRLAQEQNRPGEFTTFAAFEYTSDVEGRNLHRNVLFRGSAPARPYSSMDSRNPEDLWRWMETSRAAGHDALAIPHNPNGSDGRMFAATRFDGGPIDADWVALRARNEPAMEVFQIKGASETHPALSPDDPFAGFEIVDVRTTAPALTSRPEGSYLRDALRRGLAIAGATGANPYRLGVIASTDGHNAASPFEEDNYTGKIGNNDSTPEARLAVPAMRPGAEPVVSIVTRWGAAGLTGVWAKANTREGVFDAIRRRESYGTSGPRIRVRVAAGWTLPDGSDPGALLDREDAVAMGGVLPARPEAAARPTFVIAAQRDPRSAPLDRVQVVRGWMDGSGRTHERVFDVVCADGHAPGEHGDVCPASDAEPDPKTCAGSAEAGQAELRVRWQDPLPPSAGGTFYYVRVLEVPTCRWSTWDALRTKRPPPSGVPTTIQERAVTSPIWTH